MATLKDVFLPCGETFCLNDWRVYAQCFVAHGRRFKALKLELPVVIRLSAASILKGYEGEWLAEDERGAVSLYSEQRFKLAFKKEKNG